MNSVCTQFELSGLGLCIPKMVVSTRKAKTGEGGIKISGFHGQHHFLGPGDRLLAYVVVLAARAGTPYQKSEIIDMVCAESDGC